jgi:hypothetical protein
LAWLSIECSRGRNEDYHSSLAIITHRCSLRHMRQTLADKINCSPHIDIHDEVKVVKAKWIAITIEDLSFG